MGCTGEPGWTLHHGFDSLRRTLEIIYYLLDKGVLQT